MNGLDAANVNPDSTWNAAWPHAGFIIVKATEGITYVDTRHAARATQVRQAGKPLGHYHYFHPADNPAAQATFFLATAKPQPGETVWCDVETTDSRAWSGIGAAVLTFTATVSQQSGARCGIYSYPTFLAQLLNAATPAQRGALFGLPLWIADPNHPAGSPSLCGWPTWAIHQYGQAQGLDADLLNPTVPWTTYATRSPSPTPTPTPAPITEDDVIPNIYRVSDGPKLGFEFSYFGTTPVHLDGETAQSLTNAGAKIVPISGAVFALIPAVAGV